MHSPNRALTTSRIAVTLAILAAVSAVTLMTAANIRKTAANAPRLDGYDLCKVVIPDETPEIMCFYTGFTVSFNPAWHVPNYVVWELTAQETDGSGRRNNNFAPDPGVMGCATLADYRRSGFDRGHMAPAADMKWSDRAMRDCHYLTNIAPQDHQLNSGRWNSLEQKCRTIARRDSAIIIITGPVLTDRITRTIGPSQVAVPERFFKVILAPYANPPRAIGFVMPNRQVPDPMGALAMTVDQVEEITGFDFFSDLPDEIENQIESTLRLRDWGVR